MSHHTISSRGPAANTEISCDTLGAPPAPAKNRVLRTSLSTQSFKQATKTMPSAMADVASIRSGSDGYADHQSTTDDFHFTNDATNTTQNKQHKPLNSKSSAESMAFESGKRGDSLSQMWNILRPRLVSSMANYRSLEMPTPVQWISPSGTSWLDGTGEIEPDNGSLTLKNANGTVATKIHDLRDAIVIGTPRKRYMELIVPGVPELERPGTRLILAPTSESEFVQWLSVLLLWSHLKPAGLLSKVTNIPGCISRDSDTILLDTEMEVYFPFVKDSSISEDSDHHVFISARAESTVFSKTKQWRQVRGVLTKDGVFRIVAGAEMDNSARELYVVDMKHILSSRVRQVDGSLFDKRHVLYLQATGGILLDETEELFCQLLPLSSGSSLETNDSVPSKSSSQRHSSVVQSNMQEKLYLGFSSGKDYEGWFCGLREFTRHRVFQSGADIIRMTREVSLRVVEARLDGQSVMPDLFNETYVEVSFENTVWARTSIHNGSEGDPYWRDSFVFNDFPIMSPNFEFTIKKRTSRRGNPLRDKIVGVVVVNEQAIRHANDIETWYSVKMSKGFPQACSLCLRINYAETRILPAENYSKIERLLEDISNGLTVHISEQTGDISQVSEVCLKILLSSRKSKQLAMSWLMFLISHELRKVETQAKPTSLEVSSEASTKCDELGDEANGSEPSRMSTASLSSSPSSSVPAVIPASAGTYSVTNTLFRGNSFLTKALERYMKFNASDYLESTIGKIVRKIVVSGVYVEIDPERLYNHPRSQIERTVRENQMKLEHYASDLWKAIYASVDYLPGSFKLIFAQLRRHLIERLHQDESVVYNSVAGFLFLRFFCPALLNPKLFGLIRSHPPSNVQRSLTLITKLLQGFANRVRFGLKEPWMIPMNSFIDAHEEELIQFYKRVTLETGEKSSFEEEYTKDQGLGQRRGSHDSASSGDSEGTEGDEKYDMTSNFANIKLDSEASTLGCNVSTPFLIDRYESLAKLVELWSANTYSTKCGSCSEEKRPGCTNCEVIREFSEQCHSLSQAKKSILRILKSAETIDDLPHAKVEMKYVADTGKVMLASTQLAQSGLKHAPAQRTQNGMLNGQKSGLNQSQASSSSTHQLSLSGGSTPMPKGRITSEEIGRGIQSKLSSAQGQRLRDASLTNSTFQSSQDSLYSSKKPSNQSIWGGSGHMTRRSSGSTGDDDLSDPHGDQNRKFRWSRFTTLRRKN